MIARAVAVILRSAAKVAGGGWLPSSLSALLQWFDPTYDAAALGLYPAFTPKEAGTFAVPRGQRCYLFDGSDDYAVKSSLSLNLAGSWTVCIRGKVTSHADYTDLFSFGEPASSGVAGYLDTANGRIGYIGEGYGSGNSGTPAIGVGDHFHLAYVKSGTTVSVYLNGVLARTLPTTNPIATSGDFYVGSLYYSGTIYKRGVKNIWDAKVYNVAKTQPEIEAIYNQHLTPTTIDTTGLVAHWPCQEESGTTGYDISGNDNHLTLTNITQSTFHATDSGVKWNVNNAKGYNLSGDIVVPCDLSDPAFDVTGDVLNNAGPIALPAITEVPCITGNATDTYVSMGTQLIANAATSFILETWMYVSALTSNRLILLRQGSTTNGINIELYTDGGFYIEQWVGGSRTEQKLAVSGHMTAATWTKIKIDYDGSRTAADRMRLYIDDVLKTLTVSSNAPAVLPTTSTTECMRAADNGNGSNGRLAGWSITTNAKTYYALFDQCGPGSSNTNRDFYVVCSDGTATLVSSGIINGTISSIYANRCPYVKDWCVQYGGGIAANGSFVPGRIGSANDAAGNAKTLVAGKHGNPYSRVVPNVWNAPALVNRGVDSSDKLAPADTYESITTSTDDGFSRNGTDGTDRYFATNSPLTGDDLTNADAYTTP